MVCLPDKLMYVRRNGEESRQHLIKCSERYLRRNAVDGFTGGTFTAEELAASENGSGGPTNSYKVLINGMALASNGHAANGVTSISTCISTCQYVY